jgi:hypothetical protein
MADCTAYNTCVRATLLVIAIGFLLACQGDPTSVLERAAKHTLSDRRGAMTALSAGLDEAFLWLKDHPDDRAGALAHARPQIAKFYTSDETGAFQLHTGNGEVVLYIPSSEGRTGVWLGRTENHLIAEPGGLSPEARAKIGIK